MNRRNFFKKAGLSIAALAATPLAAKAQVKPEFEPGYVATPILSRDEPTTAPVWCDTEQERDDFLEEFQRRTMDRLLNPPLIVSADGLVTRVPEFDATERRNFIKWCDRQPSHL